ncbi:hypothetical protein FACS1894147_11120 [Spirochaetia bacterium]|nr:hypothetical protein FACS1894147_11120 [Spirochaetia bacterium]
MLQWLNAITFKSGEIPLLNDASPEIAPTTNQLNQYAVDLKVITKESIDFLQEHPSRLSQSGYRCFKNAVYECVVDIGQIGPSYQPGHAHADTFNFVLNVHNKPLVVDTGISTYVPGETRMNERGTAAHNTVTVLDKNSSEVWSSFRVGRRARVRIIEDNDTVIAAEHDGYHKTGVTHKRRWEFGDKQVMVDDYLSGSIVEGKAHLHISPGYKPEKKGAAVEIGETLFIFDNASNIDIIQTKIPNGYNQFQENYTIEITFVEFVKTVMTFT